LGVGCAILGLTACTAAATPTPAPTTTTQAANPAVAERLNSALTSLKGASYDEKVTDSASQLTGTISINAGKDIYEVDVDLSAVNFSYLVTANSLYAKVDMGGAAGAPNPKTWFLIDSTKIPASENSATSVIFDVNTYRGGGGGVAGLLTSTSDLTTPDVTHIAGTVDLTKSAGIIEGVTQIGASGDTAKKVPFTATLDAAGRLTEVRFSPADTSVGDLDIMITDYGTPSVVAAPNAVEVKPASASVYGLLGGSS
jgi:hypothetical protein